MLVCIYERRTGLLIILDLITSVQPRFKSINLSTPQV